VKNGKKRYLYVYCLLAGFAVCMLFLPSCSRSDPSAGFSRSLFVIDRLSAEGKTVLSLKKLRSLRNSAISTSQWLSLVKRERILKAYDQAADTLRLALKKMPSNATLAAVLVDTLAGMNQLEAANTFCPSLLKTMWAPVAALAVIEYLSPADPLRVNPDYWLAAYSTVAVPSFLRNASVLYAFQGNFPGALSVLDSPAAKSAESSTVFESLPDESVYLATLNFDAGYFEKVFQFLPRESMSSANRDSLALMADSAVKINDIPFARTVWALYGQKDPSASPVPWYDLAVTSSSYPEVRDNLEKALHYFPSWYPAVARYLRLVPDGSTAVKIDPIEAELEKAGFRTLAMEQAHLNDPVTREHAARVLSEAQAVSGSKVDPMIVIENFRFAFSLDRDKIRSASEMWKILEKYPSDPVLKKYAIWYFASIGHFDACFTLARGGDDEYFLFYQGLQAAMTGNLVLAEKDFSSGANDPEQAWCAEANIARIKQKTKDTASAINDYSIAAGLAPNDTVKSQLQYETARALYAERFLDRAISMLGYAVELDPSNLRAETLKRQLEAEKKAQ
jgi:tetratricopeptide (TPR) repeat protein